MSLLSFDYVFLPAPFIPTGRFQFIILSFYPRIVPTGHAIF